MSQRIQSFGGETRSRFLITDGEDVSVTLRRVVWFDQDIDGHWLVWASGPDEAGEPPETGAIIVENPTITAFIETLGELLAHPERYQHEPRFGPVGSGPDRARARLGVRRRRYANASEGDAVPPPRVVRTGAWRALALLIS